MLHWQPVARNDDADKQKQTLFHPFHILAVSTASAALQYSMCHPDSKTCRYVHVEMYRSCLASVFNTGYHCKNKSLFWS